MEGIDLNLVYEFPPWEWGKFTVSLAYNHLLRFNGEIVKDIGFTNFLGQFQEGIALVPGSLPYNKGYTQIEWTWQGFSFVNTLNYIGDYQDFGLFVNGSELVQNDAGFSPDPANPQYTRRRDVKAYLSFDTQLSYTYKAAKADQAGNESKESTALRIPPRPRFWRQWLDNTTIRIGINNLFDEPPPFNAGAFNDNYDTSLYSLRGRYYYIGLNKKF